MKKTEKTKNLFYFSLSKCRELLVDHELMLIQIKLFILQAWNDYFSGVTSPQETSVKQKTQYSNSISSALYITNSVIESSKSSNEGGAIRVLTSNRYCLLIEKTTLFHCRSGVSSGALYFYYEGECVLVNICVYNCSAISGSYQFANIEVYNGNLIKNEILESSISYCKNANYPDVLFTEYGKIIIDAVNFSLNEARQFSACSSLPCYTGDNQLLSTISYSSFSNNSASGSCCVFLSNYRSTINHKIISCNIINNNQNLNDQSYGIITAKMPASIEGSCFVNNMCHFLLMNQGSYSFTVSNCTIDSGFRTSGALNVNNLPATSFINKILCFETGNCEAFFDYAGSLTPLKKRKKLCITYFGNNPCNGKLASTDTFRVMQLVFLITFIPSI